MTRPNETAKERYLRNHAERIRIMRMEATLAEREGNPDEAERIRRIADAWDWCDENGNRRVGP